MLFIGDWAAGSQKILWNNYDDLVVLNLEGALIFEETSLQSLIEKNMYNKAGPLIANKYLPEVDSSFIFNLANNHFMDFGVDIANSSIEEISNSGHKYVGFGVDSHQAHKPLRFLYQGKQISMISLCENQFGIADSRSPGVSGMGSWIFPLITQEKKVSDIVIVSSHAGVEDFPYPAPFIKDLYRSYVEVGADLVIGHHPHMPQGFEFYGAGFIAYGLGNFAVEPKIWNEIPFGMVSLGIRVSFADEKTKISIVKFKQRAIDAGESEIVELEGEKALNVESYLTLVNQAISDDELLNKIWSVVATKCWDLYANEFISAYFENYNVLNTRAWLKSIVRKRFKPLLHHRRVDNAKLLTYHSISCESHLEIIKYNLRSKTKPRLEDVLEVESLLTHLNSLSV